MNEMTKSMLAVCIAAIGLSGTLSTGRAAVRVETREALIATGVERLGTADGSSVSDWDTTAEKDGWTRRTSGSSTVDVLVLNKSAAVAGGRLAGNAAWDAARPVVVRDDVVVPEGTTLAIGAGCIVKFTGGARLVAEPGGSIVLNGALLADFADDSVGGDTNMDSGRSEPAGEWADWVEPNTNLVEVSLWDGAAKAAPSRTYTEGVRLGTLPVLERSGMAFLGWTTDAGKTVTSSTKAGTETAVLHASWKVLKLEITPASASVKAAATNVSVTVKANAAWTASAASGSPWLGIASGASGNGNGEIVVAVGANAATGPRTGTVRVVLEGGGAAGTRDFTVEQAGMEMVAAPEVMPGDGYEFRGNAQRVVVTCSTPGAVIRYTLDGSEPDEGSAVAPALGFNVFDTTVVKARAWADGMLPSATAAARLVRLQTLAEALGVPLWEIATDAEGGWSVDVDTACEGGSSARSGAIAANGRSAMATTVSGSGTLKFRWKASCEDDPDDTWNWDHLSFTADGGEKACLDGETDWVEVAVELAAGTHVLEWAYGKDHYGTAGRDCGWVDAVTWTPTVALEGGNAIPVSWFENQGLVELGGTAEDAASADPDGDGMTTAQEYLAGTDPNDPGSVFAAHLAIDAVGQPEVSWSPALGGGRIYRLEARKTMDESEPWTDVTDETDLAGKGWRFFRATLK
jgi:hypothetical protein